jgi:uncharacterized protein (TIGR04255 family)
MLEMGAHGLFSATDLIVQWPCDWYSDLGLMTPTPKFRKPPVVEVALSVMMDPLPGFNSAHVGSLWAAEDVRRRFPKTVDQPPLESTIEHENEQRIQLGSPRVQFEALNKFKLRTWFLNEAETDLLQIQDDRVARNWRRAGTNEPYPSYDNIKGPFDQDLRMVSSFLEKAGLGEIKPIQAEVTYVNHILPTVGDVWKSHADLASVMNNWQDLRDSFLPRTEDVTFSSRYVIKEHGSFVGRLHVALQPAVAKAKDGKEVEMLVLTLTARGRPIGKGLDGALAFLDLGHDWIVRAFRDLTTPQMHRVWELQA